MAPDSSGRRRFCDACDKHVHDLSAMDERGARAFWEATADQDICISYLSDERGEIVFRHGPSRDFVSASRLRQLPANPPAKVPTGPQGPARAALSASLTAVLAACTPHGEEPELLEIDAEVIAVEQEAAPPSQPIIPTAVPTPDPQSEEPCETEEPEPKATPRTHQRKKGQKRIYRTAGIAVRDTGSPLD